MTSRLNLRATNGSLQARTFVRENETKRIVKENTPETLENVHRFRRVPRHDEHISPSEAHRNIEKHLIDGEQVAKFLVGNETGDTQPDLWR